MAEFNPNDFVLADFFETHPKPWHGMVEPQDANDERIWAEDLFAYIAYLEKELEKLKPEVKGIE